MYVRGCTKKIEGIKTAFYYKVSEGHRGGRIVVPRKESFSILYIYIYDMYLKLSIHMSILTCLYTHMWVCIRMFVCVRV